ncbi:Conserved_hypothetical protein [Hexamita inflata]|uniref:Uncharacterized protein n=1 Tax=Hexamita inflata TaxID=28002 RepID=A0AA86P614_9EUKA|nr:Conserved hypothetical protein [Hexamita inflata]
MSVYKSTREFYANLEKQTAFVHKSAQVSFQALREFIQSAPDLLQSISQLAAAECGPNKQLLLSIQNYLQSNAQIFKTQFQLLLELSAACTETKLQFQSIQNSTVNSEKCSNRLQKVNPAQLLDAQTVYKNCNRELVRMSAAFERSRFKNYSSFAETLEKTEVFKASSKLTGVKQLNNIQKQISERSVLNELMARMSGIEVEGQIEAIIGVEEQIGAVKKELDGKKYQEKGRYRTVREESD